MQTRPKPSHALLYARLSPRDGDKDEDLARMVRELQAFAVQQGVGVAEVIAERDVSGWTDDGRVERKGRWAEVVPGLEAGRWDGLVVRSLDRSARDGVETLLLIRAYGRGGWGFYAQNNDSLDDPKAASIKGLVAQWESDEKSFRIKLKWDDKAAKGDYHHGRYRPFGYTYAEGRLTPNPAEAEIVREIAARLIKGESANSISEDLDARRIPTVTGARWGRSTVTAAIKPTVAALRKRGGELLPGNWEPILDRATYLVAKAACTTGTGPRLGQNTRKHLLTGFVVCGLCGVPVGGDGDYYHCSASTSRRKTKGCGKVAINIARLDALISGLMDEYMSRMDLEVKEDVSGRWDPALKEAEADIAAIQACYEAKEITTSDWIRGIREARRRLTEIQSELEADLASAPQTPGGEDWKTLNLSQRRAAIGGLVEAVVIKPATQRGRWDPSRVEIVWRA